LDYTRKTPKGGLELSIREVTNQYRLNKWTEIVRERINSGKTVAEWCADHDIDPKRYYYWLRRVRAAACEALPSLGTGNNPIVPVNIPVPITGTTPMDQESSSDITIHLGAVTLEIRNNASAALIENTLRALQNVR
jgi:transposase-like protein